MEDLREDLLEENFNYENGSLDFSCTKLEINLFKDEVCEGSFKIYGPGSRLTRGTVFSTESRMRCLEESFIGEESDIPYSFDSRGLEEGDVVKGEFIVLSNQGEYYLPYAVSVAYPVLQSSLGGIKNLFHFTNLAKSNWEEALKLFYSSDFSRIFSGSDKQYYQIYKGLSVYPGNAQNMEEFLLAIGKKPKIEYLLDQEKIRIEDPQDQEYGFLITRNGWGYTNLSVKSESGLVEFDKSRLSDDDFLGNGCKVHFKVRQDALHGGCNYDRILICTAYETLKLPVAITEGTLASSGKKQRAHKQLLVQLMEFYQAFRLKKIGTATWLKETQKLVEQMIALDDKDVTARLFQAQLLISQERYNEAHWILEHAVAILESESGSRPALWAYQMYLNALCSRDEAYTNEVARQVEELYRRNGDWRIAWLLLYLSEEYNRSGAKKWMFLEEQFRRGCVSPMLYIEALLLIHSNPTLFMKLSEFEIQVMHYAAKKDALTKDMAEQLQCLAPREKEFIKPLYDTLVDSYKKWQDPETLSAICSQLMKGGKTSPRYFPWYAAAVEKGLRLTRLYDYYMLSRDPSDKRPIHKMVLMYYSYHSDLDYIRCAGLYAQVHQRRDELSDLYLTYLPQIEQFITEQIRKRHMNTELAVLYKAYFKEQMMNEELAQALAELLFMHQIRMEDRNCSRVIVRHSMLKEEAVYPLLDGTAMVPLYGSEYTILFENNEKQRYMGTGRYTVEKLMLPGRILKQIHSYAMQSVGLNLYLCTGGRDAALIDQENADRMEALLNSGKLEEKCRQELSIALVEHYFDADQMDKLDAFLQALNAADFHWKQRNTLLRLMVQRGMIQRACAWVGQFGCYGIEPKTAVRMFDERIRETGAEDGTEEDEILTELGMYAFRKGKYNERILRYLTCHYRGLTRELRDLYKAAASFDVDTYTLCERMIKQMIFTGSFVGEKMEIFRNYVRGGAKAQIENIFLAQCAYDYFVRDRIPEAYGFEEMLRVLSRGESLHYVCTLAVVKYYAEHLKQVGREQEKTLLKYVEELLRRQVDLPFLRQYAELVPSAARLLDKTIIEYHAAPGARAMIHYVLEREEGEEGEYLTEEMTQVYGGVCFKEFQLFFGESIQYYIMEETDSGSQLTESASLQKSNIEKGIDNSRYSLLNNLAIAQTLKDYDTMDDLLAEYERTDYLAKHLFKVK